MDPKKLLELAVEAMHHAYVPYSGYRVGAALLCADGTVKRLAHFGYRDFKYRLGSRAE